MMFDCPCVILAGGKSSRMKTDKSKLAFGGYDSLCEYQVKRLKPYFKSIFVSAKSNKFDFDVDLILDDKKESSPMVGLKKILSSFSDSSVFILSVDAPFVSKSHIEKLYRFINAYDAVIPKTKTHTHQLCGFYSSKLAHNVTNLLANNIHKISFLLKEANVKYVEFDNDDDFLNLNYIDDYKNAIKEMK